ncbi:hypothetical protein GCM10010399_08450 [Dactylosporangium fulvum]|uniref:Uncharacterized protein n=1 Tax=Dactylosporangium fulvum TaxID=53359 RepID=A0ABY5WAE4_9ACTN|nr:hypothetical protein [Dactylosporangium fulvum]UWP86517.1 hypothetical protein Dfulv_20655 [Dactylosporangium fulvum]
MNSTRTPLIVAAAPRVRLGGSCEAFRRGARALAVDQWRHQVYELAERTRAAAAAQLEALVNLAVAVRAAEEAGPSTRLRSGGWLEFAPEVTVLREVLAARVAWEFADDEGLRREDERSRLTEQIIHALESSGVPLAILIDETRSTLSCPTRLPPLTPLEGVTGIRRRAQREGARHPNPLVRVTRRRVAVAQSLVHRGRFGDMACAIHGTAGAIIVVAATPAALRAAPAHTGRCDDGQAVTDAA